MYLLNNTHHTGIKTHTLIDEHFFFVPVLAGVISTFTTHIHSTSRQTTKKCDNVNGHKLPHAVLTAGIIIHNFHCNNVQCTYIYVYRIILSKIQ